MGNTLELVVDDKFDKYTQGMFDEQEQAFNEIYDFFKENRGQFSLKRFRAAGGSGKTWTVKRAIRALQDIEYMSIAVVSFTGRAAMQISDQWVNGMTVHGLMYSPILDEDGNLKGWSRKNLDEIRGAYDAIIVEEASMLPSKIFFDLVEIGLPILLMGDGEQLPAIDGDIKDFNLMIDTPIPEVADLIAYPDSELHVNRRTDPSLEAIINITTRLREANVLPRFVKSGGGVNIVKRSEVLTVPFHKNNQFDIILCGMNKTRKKINELVRISKGYDEVRPKVGEQIICLKNSVVGGQTIYNGEIFYVDAVRDGYNFAHYLARTESGKIVDLKISDRTWESEKGIKDQEEFQVFTYGYCISVHKCQGGTFNNVLFYDEDVSFFLDQRRFRYTACSRAAKTLTIAT